MHTVDDTFTCGSGLFCGDLSTLTCKVLTDCVKHQDLKTRKYGSHDRQCAVHTDILRVTQLILGY